MTTNEDLKTIYDHPSVILTNLGKDAAKVGVVELAHDMDVAAATLRNYETVSGVTFTALDDDALTAIRRAYTDVITYERDDPRNRWALEELAAEVADLLGLDT